MNAPFVVGSDTSKAAADSLGGEVLSRLEARVFNLILARGAEGATDDEVEVETGLSHQSASARRVSLVARGLARDSGRRRKTRSGRRAVVWVVEAHAPASQPTRPHRRRPDASTVQLALQDLEHAVQLARTLGGYEPSEELREVRDWLLDQAR